VPFDVIGAAGACHGIIPGQNDGVPRSNGIVRASCGDLRRQGQSVPIGSRCRRRAQSPARLAAGAMHPHPAEIDVFSSLSDSAPIPGLEIALG
jgi:hypothetical protein